MARRFYAVAVRFNRGAVPLCTSASAPCTGRVDFSDTRSIESSFHLRPRLLPENSISSPIIADSSALENFLLRPIIHRCLPLRFRHPRPFLLANSFPQSYRSCEVSRTFRRNVSIQVTEILKDYICKRIRDVRFGTIGIQCRQRRIDRKAICSERKLGIRLSARDRQRFVL